MKLLKSATAKVKGFAQVQITKGIDKVLTKLYAKKEEIVAASKTAVKKNENVRKPQLIAKVSDGKLVGLTVREGTPLSRNKFENPHDEYEITTSVSGEEFRKNQRNIRLLEDVRAIINGE